MKILLRLLKQNNLFLLGLFFLMTIYSKAQEKSKIKYSPKQLSISASLVSPLYYGLGIINTTSGQGGYEIYTKSILLPDFKLSYILNLQYKSKTNWVYEAEFQPYQLFFTGPKCEGPTRYINDWSSSFNYNFYRIYFGVGKQFTIKRSFINVGVGVASFVGNGYVNVQIYNKGVFSENGQSTIDFGEYHPFVKAEYGYSLNKRFSCIAGINYGLLLSPGFGTNIGPNSNILFLPYTIKRQNLLGVNVGLRFNIISK